MAYYTSFLKITWGGTFEAEEEVWTNGLNFADQSIVPMNLEETFDETITDVAAAIQAWHTNVDTGISNRCRLEWVKYALIATDGKYLVDPFVYDYPTPINGGSTGAIETQRSLALSFKTPNTRGPASNGRIYVPAFRLGVGINGRLATTDQEDFVAAGKVFIDAINAAVSGRPDVLRVAVVSKVGAGTSSYVTSVRAGDVIDSQRRRKNKMREVYAELPIVP